MTVKKHERRDGIGHGNRAKQTQGKKIGGYAVDERG